MPTHRRARPIRPAGALALAAALLLLVPARASDNPLPPVAAPPPGMDLLHEDLRDPDTHPVPVRPSGAALPVTEPAIGRVHWRLFRGPIPATPLGAVEAVAAPWEAAGLRRVLDCGGAACGGFDFRLAISVAPQPHMVMNPADFHQRTLAGTDAQGRPLTVSLLASRFGGLTHLQAVTVLGRAVPEPALPTPQPDNDVPVANPPPAAVSPAETAARRPATDPVAPQTAGLAASLDATGRALLEGLAFGSAGRGDALESAPVLDAVAALMAERPALALVVVGHSDAVGSLDTNLRLSRARAEAVVAALVARGVPRDRLSAEGAGWLSPVAPNDSEAGRAANRRVEIVAR